MKKTIALILAAMPAFAADFEVFPAQVNLKFQRDRQSVVCRFTEPGGIQRNVTTEAKFTFADPSKAKVENGVILPIADGATTVKIEWNGKTAEIPVKVEAITTDPAVSFRLDVM